MNARGSSVADQPEGVATVRVPPSKRVLLVSDEPYASTLLQHTLKELGLIVELAVDAPAALRQLNATTPDALFVLLRLDGATGAELVKDARRDLRFGQRPIYLCTVCSALTSWSKHTARGGPTKFYSLLATPMETILSQFAADVAPDTGLSPYLGEASDQVSGRVFGCIGEKLREHIEALAASIPQFAAAPDKAPWTQRCAAVRQDVSALVGCAAVAGQDSFARDATTVEAYLKELCDKPKHMTEASLSIALSSLRKLETVCREKRSKSAAPAEPAAVPVQDTPSFPMEIAHKAVGLFQKFRSRGQSSEPAAGDAPASSEGQAAAESPDVAVVSLTTEGKILLVFPSCVAMFGWERDEISGKPIEVLLEGSAPKELKKILSQKGRAPDDGDSDESRCVEVRARRKDGSVFPARVSLTLTRQDGKTHWLSRIENLEGNETSAPASEETEAVAAPPEAPAASDAAQTAVPEPSRASSGSDDKGKRQSYLEQELAGLSTLCADLLSKYTAEQLASAEAARRAAEFETRLKEESAELQRLKTELEQVEKQRLELESDSSKNLTAANAAAEQAHVALREKTAQCRLLESEFSAFKAASAERDTKLAAEQQALSEAKKRAGALDQQLRDAAAELELVKDEVKRITKERQALEATAVKELAAAKSAVGQAQKELADKTSDLAAAKASAEQAHAALKEKDAGTRQLEAELATIKKTLSDAQARLSTEQQSTAEAAKRASTLEQQAKNVSAELEAAKAEIKKLAQQQKDADAKWSKELAAARTSAEQAQGGLKEKTNRCQQLEAEVAALKKTSADFEAKLVVEHKAAAEAGSRAAASEQLLKDARAELDRFKAETAKLKHDQKDADAKWEKELAAAKSAAEQAQGGLKDRTARCQQLEADLATLKKALAEKESSLASEQHAAAEAKKNNDALESRLHKVQAELKKTADACAQAKAETKKQGESRHALEAELVALRADEAVRSAELAELRRATEEAKALQLRATTELAEERDERRRIEQRATTLAAQLKEIQDRVGQHLQSMLDSARQLQAQVPPAASGKKEAASSKDSTLVTCA